MNASDNDPDVAGRPNQRSDAIYGDLRHKIIQTELRPGERLREQSLASAYGTSRTPIRLVLDRLAADGLVTMKPGAGASVSLVDFDALAEVWAVRMKITELMADVIELPTGSDMVTEASALVEQVANVASPGELVSLFDDYHVLLLGLMRSGPIRHIYDQMYAQTARMFTILLPDLDQNLEAEAISLELDGFVAACKSASAVEIASNRMTFLQGLLERINHIPLLRPPTVPTNASASSLL